MTNLVLIVAVVLGNVVAIVPASRLSDRIGRKPVIYAACGIGAAGAAIAALAPSVPIAIMGGTLFGAANGIFLAVDWALMTDIIPRASAGRYMGMSNVATGSAPLFAAAIGGLVLDVVASRSTEAAGARAAFLVGVVLFLIAAVLLRPVVEPPPRMTATSSRRPRRPETAQSPISATTWAAAFSPGRRDAAGSSRPRNRRVHALRPARRVATVVARGSARNVRHQRREPARLERRRLAHADRTQECERVVESPPPRHRRPDEHEIVGAERPLPEPEQRLELDDREREHDQRQQPRQREEHEAPARALGGRTSHRGAGTHFIQVAIAPGSRPRAGR